MDEDSDILVFEIFGLMIQLARLKKELKRGLLTGRMSIENMYREIELLSEDKSFESSIYKLLKLELVGGRLFQI